MIYITGDCHGNFERFDLCSFPEQMNMTKDDYVIICGDFCGICESLLLDSLESLPFTLLFADGNHENFDCLNRMPVELWHGGKVHKIRPSVIHLMRGQVFELEGKKIFTFGGGKSQDLEGGILEPEDPDYEKKKKEFDEKAIPYRINHENWWKEELPSEEEMDEGWKNLRRYNHEVDYIVTHSSCTSTQEVVTEGTYNSDYLTEYLEEIKQRVKFQKWYFGHYHKVPEVNEKEIPLWEEIIRVE